MSVENLPRICKDKSGGEDRESPQPASISRKERPMTQDIPHLRGAGNNGGSTVPNGCHLYFVSAVGRDITKIGISSDPRRRLAGLKTASPFPLSLFASVGFENRARAERAERVIHAALDDHRMSGEWFAISAASALEVNDAVSDMIRTGDFHPDDLMGCAGWSRSNT